MSLTPTQRAKRLRDEQPRLNSLGILAMTDGYCPMRIYTGVKNYLLLGFFQSPAYFKTVSDKVKAELVYKDKLSLHNASMLYRIRSARNSVCVHVRRGDYNGSPILDICGPNYYSRAIQLMRAVRPGATFFIFSNGMDWTRKNIKFPDSTIFVEGNSEADAAQEFELMRDCDHFIIANSTFSWWAQYLGSNPYKAVVAPTRFFGDDTPSDIRDKGWMVIDPGR